MLHEPSELKLEFTPILPSLTLVSHTAMDRMVLFSHIFKFSDKVPKTFNVSSRVFWDAYSASETQKYLRVWSVKRETFGFDLKYTTDLEREVLRLQIASQIWEHVPVLHDMKKTRASAIYDNVRIWDNSGQQLGYSIASIGDLKDKNEMLGRLKASPLSDNDYKTVVDWEVTTNKVRDSDSNPEYFDSISAFVTQEFLELIKHVRSRFLLTYSSGNINEWRKLLRKSYGNIISVEDRSINHEHTFWVASPSSIYPKLYFSIMSDTRNYVFRLGIGRMLSDYIGRFTNVTGHDVAKVTQDISVAVNASLVSANDSNSVLGKVSISAANTLYRGIISSLLNGSMSRVAYITKEVSTIDHITFIDCFLSFLLPCSVFTPASRLSMRNYIAFWLPVLIPVNKMSVAVLGDTPDRDTSVDWLDTQLKYNVYPPEILSLLKDYFGSYSNTNLNESVELNLSALITKDIYYPHFCGKDYKGETPLKYIQAHKLLVYIEKNYLVMTRAKPNVNALQTIFKALSLLLKKNTDYTLMVDYSERLMRRLSLCPMLLAQDHKRMMEPIVTSEYFINLAPHGSIFSLIFGCSWGNKIESLTTIQPATLFHGLSQMRALDHLCAVKTLVFDTLKKLYFSKSERWGIVLKLLYDDGIFNRLVEGMIRSSGNDKNILDSLVLPRSTDYFDGIGDIKLGLNFADSLLLNCGELQTFAFDPKPNMTESKGMLFFSMRNTALDSSGNIRKVSFKEFSALAIRQTHSGTSTAFDDLIIECIKSNRPIIFDFPIMSEIKEYVPGSVYVPPFTIDIDDHVTPVRLGKLQVFTLKDYQANRNLTIYPYINHPMFVPVNLDYIRNTMYDSLNPLLESITKRTVALMRS